MESKWSKYKADAIRLRKQGKSLPYVHTTLGIPKSTLSYWFKDIILTKNQKERLQRNWHGALIKARTNAAIAHKREKIQRLEVAERESTYLLNQININDSNIIEIGLALLYLGEGSKTNSETGMGSSDPLILKFFVTCLRKIYKVPEAKIKCQLHLRADQDPERMLEFWSNELQISKENFTKTYLDARTKNSVTYDSYKGVCLVRCGQVAIQRKLIYIAKHFCSEISSAVK